MSFQISPNQGGEEEKMTITIQTEFLFPPPDELRIIFGLTPVIPNRVVNMDGSARVEVTTPRFIETKWEHHEVPLYLLFSQDSAFPIGSFHYLIDNSEVDQLALSSTSPQMPIKTMKSADENQKSEETSTKPVKVKAGRGRPRLYKSQKLQELSATAPNGEAQETPHAIYSDIDNVEDTAAILSSMGQQPSTNPQIVNPFSELFASDSAIQFRKEVIAVTQNWTPEDLEYGRRLVYFWRDPTFPESLHCSFKEPISTRSVVVSCIYWKKVEDFFFTSVDCLQLLEGLIDKKFTSDQKNRIRRNLEGFQPITVSRNKQQHEEFFKQIMGFPKPRPRNIEKDVKVYLWKILSLAVIKIISRFGNPDGEDADLADPQQALEDLEDLSLGVDDASTTQVPVGLVAATSLEKKRKSSKLTADPEEAEKPPRKVSPSMRRKEIQPLQVPEPKPIMLDLNPNMNKDMFQAATPLSSSSLLSPTNLGSNSAFPFSPRQQMGGGLSGTLPSLQIPDFPSGHIPFPSNLSPTGSSLEGGDNRHVPSNVFLLPLPVPSPHSFIPSPRSVDSNSKGKLQDRFPPPSLSIPPSSFSFHTLSPSFLNMTPNLSPSTRPNPGFSPMSTFSAFLFGENSQPIKEEISKRDLENS